MRTRIAAYAVIVDDEQILLSHTVVENWEAWTLPGGGIDPGEHPEDAAIREVFEETGFTVEITDTLGVDSQVLDPRNGEETPLHAIRIIFTARIVAGELVFEHSGSTDRAAWFALDELPRPRAASIDLGLEWALDLSADSGETR
ncbi:NUDIX hydrolase [Humidisolicoccus flavus]|uniref:NUDIX hydrolase n=1 Tax=Humidisolicoccus flavus TaxID=3111414 RepID=UPI0032445E2B